jgi:flagellar assembly protein FliH
MLCRLITGDHVDAIPVVQRSSSSPTSRPAPAAQPGCGAAEAPKPSAEEIDSAIQHRLRLAHEAGFREGEVAGRMSAEDAVHEAVERLAAAVADVSQVRIAAIRRAEADTVRLAVEVARRVLHRELSLDPAALEALVGAALAKLSAQEVYRVRVHPDQEPMLRACLLKLARNPEVEVVSDSAQERGGAVFETNRGALDASVETQFREIERGLADQLGDRA